MGVIRDVRVRDRYSSVDYPVYVRISFLYLKASELSIAVTQMMKFSLHADNFNMMACETLEHFRKLAKIGGLDARLAIHFFIGVSNVCISFPMHCATIFPLIRSKIPYLLA